MSKRGEKGRAGSDVDGGIGDLMKTGWNGIKKIVTKVDALSLCNFFVLFFCNFLSQFDFFFFNNNIHS